MRLITKAALVSAAALATLAAPASAQTPPTPVIPNIPATDVARFQMTIHGFQTSNFEFDWVPGDECGRHANATLAEQWNYARGKAVVMEFSRIAPRVILLGRKGRPPSDAAFAAPGNVTRHATGFFEMGSFPGCGGWHSLIGPTCDKRYNVQSELHLLWFNGKLSLEKGGRRRYENPAKGCGNVDGVLNFDELPHAYPSLSKQRAALTAKQIFGSNRGFRLTLKDRFLPAVGTHTWPNASEKLNGRTTLTFKRLR